MNEYNKYTKLSFDGEVRKKVLRIITELKEIQSKPDSQKTEYALDREDVLKKKLEYYLVPVQQRVKMSAKILDKNYINYLADNPDVVNVLMERVDSAKVLETNNTKRISN